MVYFSSIDSKCYFNVLSLKRRGEINRKIGVDIVLNWFYDRMLIFVMCGVLFVCVKGIIWLNSINFINIILGKLYDYYN